MTTQDELARELFIADNFNQSREQSIIDWQWFEDTNRGAGIEHYKTMAAGVIAAGYVKVAGPITFTDLARHTLGELK